MLLFLYLKKIYEWKKPKGVRALNHRRVMLNNLKEQLATLTFKVHQHQLIGKKITFWQYTWDIPLKTYNVCVCLRACMLLSHSLTKWSFLQGRQHKEGLQMFFLRIYWPLDSYRHLFLCQHIICFCHFTHNTCHLSSINSIKSFFFIGWPLLSLCSLARRGLAQTAQTNYI